MGWHEVIYLKWLVVLDPGPVLGFDFYGSPEMTSNLIPVCSLIWLRQSRIESPWLKFRSAYFNVFLLLTCDALSKWCLHLKKIGTYWFRLANLRTRRWNLVNALMKFMWLVIKLIWLVIFQSKPYFVRLNY